MSDGIRLHDHIDGHASQRGAAPALRDGGGVALDWAGYRTATLEAAEILERRGVRAGDRVLIVAENCAATAVAVFAASRIGACAVPVNARMTAAELALIEEHCTPRAILYTSGGSYAAAAHGHAAEEVETGFGRVHVAARGAAGEAVEEDVAVILYTTGTTGAPKGVMLTHDNMDFGGSASARLRAMVPDDRLYGALPLTHVFGLASLLTAGAVAGAEVQLEARFSPGALLAALEDGATVLPAVPQMHALLMRHTAEAGIDRLEGGALRYVSSGAAPLDPAWKRKAEAFYGLPLQNGYGMTESTAGICGTRNDIGDPDISVGPPLPGCEVEIAEPDEGGVGEIVTRGPHVMKGYFRAPEQTREILSETGWLSTGDMGLIDTRGHLHVVGRRKELIIRSGFNVYPPEVEAALNDHPQVVQSAVIGRPRAGNEDVLAFVQAAEGGVDPATLRDFVSARLSGYKCPGAIFVVDALPAAATGKILKHMLLDTFAERISAHDRGD